MSDITEDNILAIGRVLNDNQRPLKERFRALFTLKSIGGPVSIKCIQECFSDTSALLKHELAYCLGQMQDKEAIPLLKSVLKNVSQEPMVRHEAGEALGAIGAAEVYDVLQAFSNDSVVEVAETCQLALDRIKWLSDPNNNVGKLSNNPFCSVDPAPPSEETDVDALKEILFDEKQSLFDRYRAMFSLRNMRSERSVLTLSESLKVGSALFRHEVAFVLGQLQEACSIPYLKASLEDVNENEMVRHECAEALGAIATGECFELLKQFVQDKKQVVSESCIIALDMCEYENSPEFQYANTLLKV